MTIVGLNRAQRRMVARRYGIDPHLVGSAFASAQPPAGPDADTITVPTAAHELEAMLAEPAKMQKLFSQQGAFGQFVTNYARTVLDKDLSIATQVREQTEATLREWLKENEPEAVKRLPLNVMRPGNTAGSLDGRAGLHNPRAMGARLDSEFDNSADYFRTIWHNTQKDGPTQAKLSRLRAAWSSSVPSEGGFLIPETLRSELLRVSLETAIVRPRARVIPMESLTVPFPCVDSTSNASSVYGGVVAYWTDEGQTLTSSQAKFGRVVLTAKKLTAYAEVPNELVSDSAISFQAFLDGVLPEALSFYEDDAFLNGNGAGQPLGFLHAANQAAVSVAAESGQASATILWENIIKMYSRMLPSSLNRAVWIASIDTFPQLATMALAVGTGGTAIWLNNGASGPPMTILGRPVIFTEKTPTVGTVGDISFVDLAYYLIGDRQVMSATSSPHYLFAQDQTAFKIVQRVDGQPWLKSPITPKNGSTNTLTPFVKLATR